jgi:acyl carrier protein
VADRLGVDVETLRPDVELGEELAVDSLDLADLVVALEEELSLVLPWDLIATVRTFGDLVDVACPKEIAVGLASPPGLLPALHERRHAAAEPSLLGLRGGRLAGLRGVLLLLIALLRLR